MTTGIRNFSQLKLGYAAFLISVLLTRVVHVQGNVGDFAAGLFTGLAIALLLVGIYQKSHTAK